MVNIQDIIWMYTGGLTWDPDIKSTSDANTFCSQSALYSVLSFMRMIYYIFQAVE